MKALPILLIAIAGACSFYVGALSRPAAPERENADTPTAVSALTKTEEHPSASSIGKLFKAKPTKHRALSIELGILNLNAEELAALWDAEHAGFDYNNGDDDKIIRSIFKRLGELDPALAFEKLETTGVARHTLLPEVLAGWTSADPDAAIDWCRANRNERAAPSCIGAIINQVGAGNRETAVDLYLTLKQDKSLPTFNWNTHRLFSRWAKEDPQAAIAGALRIHNALGSDMPIKHSIESWAKFDGPAAANWALNESPESSRTNALVYMMSGWAELEPREAADFALANLSEHDAFSTYMLHALDGWTHNDFSSAAGWVDAIADPEIRTQLQQTLVDRSRRYADSEPALAYALEHLAENPGLLIAIKRNATEVANDAPAALAWGREHLTDPKQLTSFTNHVLRHFSRSNPTESAELLAALPSNYVDLGYLHNHTASTWASDDPTAARTWVESLPEGDARDAALIGFASGWMRDKTQLPAAAEWIDNFPPGDFRDQLGARQARATMAAHEPRNAIAAAAQIGEPFLRDQIFEDILKRWYGDEIKAEVAREFIESTDLITDTVRWRVLNRKDGHP